MTLSMFSSSYKPSTSRTAAFFIYQYSTAPRMATRKLTNHRRPGRVRSSSLPSPAIDITDDCVFQSYKVPSIADILHLSRQRPTSQKTTTKLLKYQASQTTTKAN
ncbi:unnamed protein product [Larinioides sclopetarius]|uniref:Uncharacterized protein n=1 Tax=Larinioides sclopetarius TaxID=280406 RepID=A0AAV2C230_9ARAC